MNIFIYGLNYSVKREDLINLFSPYGEVVSARIIIDRETHRSRGYGFVDMKNEEDGKAAIAALNGSNYKERVINVAIANERPVKKNA
ncbi:MAG: RNA-binding protein [Bacteroidales bacterium]|nr:RNA-binding protein [Bacteroidales bacterium]MDD4670237.1 RNA-binding protein [Bacteroidales bacterium]